MGLLLLAAMGFGLVQLYEQTRPYPPRMIIADDADPLDETTAPERELSGENQQLLTDIRSLRHRVLQGELVIDWPPVDPGQDPGISGSYEDANEMLFALEEWLVGPNPDVMIFLKHDVSQEDIDRLLGEIETLAGVTKVTFVSKEEALAELKEDLKDKPEVLESLEGNPLPPHIEAYLQDPSAAQSLVQTMSGRPEVDEAHASSTTSNQNIRKLFEYLRERARPSTTTSTDPAPGEILSELPPLALEDLAHVRVDTASGDPQPFRILSPVQDEDVVRGLLEAYEEVSLWPDSVWAPGTTQASHTLTFVTRQGLEVRFRLRLDEPLVYTTKHGDQESVEKEIIPHAPAQAAELVAAVADLLGRRTAELGSLPDQRPTDFGLVVAYGVTAKNVLDTAGGTFSKDLINGYVPSTTTELRLTGEELDQLYERLREMEIQSYPGDRVAARPMTQTIYYLRLSLAGDEKEILWANLSSFPSPATVRLREFFDEVRTLIEAKQEYKELPEARGGYL